MINSDLPIIFLRSINPSPLRLSLLIARLSPITNNDLPEFQSGQNSPSLLYQMYQQMIPTVYCHLYTKYDLSPQLFQDRKSTRLNSSHVSISYAVFCLKKKTYRTYRQLVMDSTAFV